MDKIVPWTKLQDHPIWIQAKKKYNVRYRSYHNFGHIERMYTRAYSLSIRYNRELDWAILGHDVIYDRQHDSKEFASVNWLYNKFKEHEVKWSPEIQELIMCTEDHIPKSSRQLLMIVLDLYELILPAQRSINYLNVINELTYLYFNSTKVEILASNRRFMEGLRVRLGVTINNLSNESPLLKGWTHPHSPKTLLNEMIFGISLINSWNDSAIKEELNRLESESPD